MLKNHKLFGAIIGSVIALTMLSCGKEGRTLALTNAPMSYETGTWPLSIRSGRVYTKATVAIEL